MCSELYDAFGLNSSQPKMAGGDDFWWRLQSLAVSFVFDRISVSLDNIPTWDGIFVALGLDGLLDR